MDTLVLALGPAFAAGFALQQLLEILDPILDKTPWDKKIVLGIVSLVVGLILAFGAGLRVLKPLGVVNADFWDAIITGLIVSAGTEGFNSIMKFLGYSKEKKKGEAVKEMEGVGQEALELAREISEPRISERAAFDLLPQTTEPVILQLRRYRLAQLQI